MLFYFPSIFIWIFHLIFHFSPSFFSFCCFAVWHRDRLSSAESTEIFWWKNNTLCLNITFHHKKLDWYWLGCARMSRIKEVVRGYFGVDDEQQKGCRGTLWKSGKTMMMESFNTDLTFHFIFIIFCFTPLWKGFIHFISHSISYIHVLYDFFFLLHYAISLTPLINNFTIYWESFIWLNFVFKFDSWGWWKMRIIVRQKDDQRGMNSETGMVKWLFLSTTEASFFYWQKILDGKAINCRWSICPSGKT